MKIFDVIKNFDNFSLNVKSLDITTGRIYGIVGSNGCGKTTLMKIMAGVMPPDSGRVDFEGLSPRDITMIFRKPYLLHDTVIRNLEYPLKVRKIQPDKEQIEHFLEIAGLLNHRNEYALSLSAGEQQKLSLIRAMIFSPEMVFIDEGFASMDIESVAFFEKYILELQCAKPKTWVLVSHQLANIKRLCDYVFFMQNGELKAEGPTNELLTNPENAEFKRYLQYV